MLGDGERLGRKRVERLMRAAGLSGLRPRRKGRTTIRVPGVCVCEDLVDRAFLASAPNWLWVADITYLRTWKGWVYLVAVQDIFSRRIVGWSMADHMRTELVSDALQMALARRQPEPGLIWHSDQGSQFVSLAFGQAGPRRGHRPVHGLEGRLLRQRRRRELLRHAQEGTHPRTQLAFKAELRTEVFDYIEIFFNRRRPHSTLGFLSPAQFETISLSQDHKTQPTSVH